MTTLAGTQDTLEGLVTSLLNLENDAIEAYDAVIERLEDNTLSSKVSEFRQDHHNHISALSEFAKTHGFEIPDGTAKSMLTSGKIVLADLFGDDTILKAMRTNEEDTVTAYENALNQSVCRDELRTICTQAHEDEVRHREWMESASHRKAA